MFGGDDLSKNLLICDLLELYGPLLTEKQSRLLELYYFDDLSLSEIAENEGGSRQGAMDVIKEFENLIRNKVTRIIFVIAVIPDMKKVPVSRLRWTGKKIFQ